jgi:transcriptional regulator with AAA-type ATPase domain
MLISGRTLFAFVDPKNPFMPSEVAGEEQPGPILSMMAARQFDFLFLFHTPHVRENAEATREEVARRHPKCVVMTHELPVADPKNYSLLMGHLARKVREIARSSESTENYICVSSGTAEMRAAWFLLAAVGVLPATLLQIGSPAEPLFGAANVKEVYLNPGNWDILRDLVMPQEYISPRGRRRLERTHRASESQVAPGDSLSGNRLGAVGDFFKDVFGSELHPSASLPPAPGLEDALQELGIFTGSAVIRSVVESAAIAAQSDVPVLLLGETGTGKELFAKLVHRMSARNGRDMVTINCAAIPKDLAESFLFGHERGAFTGASRDQKGKFEHSNGSTLFRYELAELSPAVRAKLLKVIEDGKVEPLGSNLARKVDVRIVAATNRNLQEEVASGRFRQDLYYRLGVVRILLPPLRDRPGEISQLAVALLKRINQRYQRQRSLSKDALRRLEQHHWAGNVRELSNVLEHSVLYSRTEVLGPDDLSIETVPAADPLAGLPAPAPGFSLDGFLKQVRRQLILRALEKSNGNQSAAADLLGISKQAVSSFLKGQTDNPD